MALFTFHSDLMSHIRKNKGLLVNRPYTNWIKISYVPSKHTSLHYHHDCDRDADILKSAVENPTLWIDIMSNSGLQKQLNENKHILHHIMWAILYLGKQGLPFHCDVENLSFPKNPGNFLALLKVFAENDEILKKHLTTPNVKNTTYLSRRNQNEIINVIGHDIILANIVSEIKKAHFYSVLVDEVSSHNVEHLPVCVHFVDSENHISRRFCIF